jgi:hypothetical protein
MTTDLQERLEESLTDSGEPKYAHYAESVSVTEGYVLGKPVVAICGQIFIPSRDPKKFPLCPNCMDIAKSLFIQGE